MLVRNIGIRGKNKLADRWEKYIYFIVDQPDSDLPVYNIKRESMVEVSKGFFIEILFFHLWVSYSNFLF